MRDMVVSEDYRHMTIRSLALKTNRELSCQTCKATLALPPVIPDSSAISSALQMQPENSQMF